MLLHTCKRLLFTSIFLMIASVHLAAQDFITRGKIEYEIRRNNKHLYSDEDRTNNPFIAQQPQFDVSYRNLIFSNNIFVYQKGRDGATPSIYINDNAAYSNLDQQKIIRSTRNFDEQYVYEDSTKKVKWKMENETRKIAGFTCRKAIGRIYDSVYVVAFYCPEIVSNGGPELFSGLPGMILGLAIPRYYTTWFATKLEVADIDETKIIAPAAKKNKVYTKQELAGVFLKKYKDSGAWKEATTDQIKQQLGDYLVY